jgi:hypothetical protein
MISSLLRSRLPHFGPLRGPGRSPPRQVVDKPLPLWVSLVDFLLFLPAPFLFSSVRQGRFLLVRGI